MVFIEGNEVVFHATFLARHSDQTIIHAPLGNSPLNFRVTFQPLSQTGAISWHQDPNGLIQVVVTPADGLGSANSAPAELYTAPDGRMVYLTYTQQTMNNASLMNFFILKGPGMMAPPPTQ
jgi:hypothetical protein